MVKKKTKKTQYTSIVALSSRQLLAPHIFNIQFWQRTVEIVSSIITMNILGKFSQMVDIHQTSCPWFSRNQLCAIFEFDLCVNEVMDAVNRAVCNTSFNNIT